MWNLKSDCFRTVCVLILVAGLFFCTLASGILGAGSYGAVQDTRASYEAEVAQWRKERVQEIAGENGWLGLIGLFWLKEGENRFGSDASSDIVLPEDKCPKHGGSIWLAVQGDRTAVRIEALAAARITSDSTPVSSVTLKSDADGKPTVLEMSSLRMFAIKRGDRMAIRVRDTASTARKHFRGLDYFPLDGRWRIEAKLERYDPPKMIPIANVTGSVDDNPSPGALVFEIGGKPYRLDPILEKGSPKLFVIFADATSGRETYGAGRFVYVDPPDADGRTVIDFNRAHNPSCAFTKFATCPLPPRQNRLPIRIEAGEKKYAGSEH